VNDLIANTGTVTGGNGIYNAGAVDVFEPVSAAVFDKSTFTPNTADLAFPNHFVIANNIIHDNVLSGQSAIMSGVLIQDTAQSVS